jgi:hypothetical protein
MNQRKQLIGTLVAFVVAFALGHFVVNIPRLTWGYLGVAAWIIGTTGPNISKKSKIRTVVALLLGFAGGYFLFPKEIAVSFAANSSLAGWQTGLLSALLLGGAWALVEGINIVHSRLWATILGVLGLLGPGIIEIAKLNNNSWKWGVQTMLLGLVLGAVLGRIYDHAKKLQPPSEEDTTTGVVGLNLKDY